MIFIFVGNRPMDTASDWAEQSKGWTTDAEVKATMKAITTPIENVQNIEVRTDIQYSAEQMDLINLLNEQIQFEKKKNLQNKRSFKIKRVMVQGKAGSGKNTVIGMFVHTANEAFPGSVAVTAPTGIAAINVNGKTLHNIFKISPNVKYFQPLDGKQQQELQNSFRNVLFLIIDKMSMVGLRMLNYVNKRCQEAKSNNEPFGGLYVYMFGDFRQLSPVGDPPMFEKKPAGKEAQEGLLAFKTFQTFVELKQCHRQSGSEEAAFRTALDHVADGATTQDDYDLLTERRRAILSKEEIDSFDNAIHLFPTNAQVIRHNDKVLRDSKLPIARIVSKNNPNYRPITNKSLDEDIEEGLLHIIKLQVGNRVMLRTNISVSHGLVNGSIGTVRAIVFKEDELPPALPKYILVEFDNYKGPTLPSRPGLVPIEPVTRSFRKGNTTFTRTQLPIMLAYASTIHKIQGLTLDKVVVEIGSAEMCNGLTYVAMSRVRQLKNLMFNSAFSKARLDSIATHKRIEDQNNFIRNWFQSHLPETPAVAVQMPKNPQPSLPQPAPETPAIAVQMPENPQRLPPPSPVDSYNSEEDGDLMDLT